jgi:hypothetical protein
MDILLKMKMNLKNGFMKDVIIKKFMTKFYYYKIYGYINVIQRVKKVLDVQIFLKIGILIVYLKFY